ncbi:MAG TPA: alpha/beta hydrolase [Sorangium sp.]|nr:alpha/beta hydrolase [Sorangium sp.]
MTRPPRSSRRSGAGRDCAAALQQSEREMWLDPGPSGYPGGAVEKISCKALIARGEDDHLTSSDAVLRLARRTPDSRLLTIPDAGHVTFQDQPELFMRSLLEFLG